MQLGDQTQAELKIQSYWQRRATAWLFYLAHSCGTKCSIFVVLCWYCFSVVNLFWSLILFYVFGIRFFFNRFSPKTLFTNMKSLPNMQTCMFTLEKKERKLEKKINVELMHAFLPSKFRNISVVGFKTTFPNCIVAVIWASWKKYNVLSLIQFDFNPH